ISSAKHNRTDWMGIYLCHVGTLHNSVWSRHTRARGGIFLCLVLPHNALAVCLVGIDRRWLINRHMGTLPTAGAAPLIPTPFTQWPQFDHRERDAILAVLESGNWGGYPFPNEIASRFSRQFAAHQDSKHALCAANGTVTLEIALKAIGIGPGDEVIVPAYTF